MLHKISHMSIEGEKEREKDERERYKTSMENKSATVNMLQFSRGKT